MKKLFLFLFISLFSLQAYSQVNIETTRNKANKEGFWGELKGGLEIQKGNVEITAYNLENISHYQNKKHHVFLKANTSKGQQNNKNFKNNSFSHIRWTWMYWDKIGFEIFTQAQYDDFKNLKIRQLNGCGMRYEVFKSNKFILTSGSGIMSDYEKLENNTETLDTRSTSYISLLKVFNKNNSILGVIYYQPLIKDFNDYRINLEALIKTSLIKSINLKIENSIVFLYDTKPPEDVLTNDFIVKTNLVYSW